MSSPDSAYTNAITRTKPCGCRLVTDDYHDTVIPCEAHGGRKAPMSTIHTAPEKAPQHPSATLAAFMVIIAVALIAAAVTLTLTGHPATDAWGALFADLSALLGLHIPTPR